jgi:hypothetical protein
MSFWNRRPDEKVVERSYVDQTANQAARDLSEGADPRSSIAVEMMLKWLWQLDIPKMRAMHRVFGAPGLDPEQYVHFLEALASQLDGEPPLQPFPVVANRLRDLLAGFLTTEHTPLGDRENYHSNRVIIENGVSMVGLLEMVEAHGVVCRLLAAANFRLQRRGWSADTSAESSGSQEVDARNLVRLTTDCLLTLPPNAIPEFWSRMRALSMARDLCPVAAQMRDRRAVPYLLEALPYLDEDRQSDVIVVLGKIKDTRAVPALQELAADKSRLTAPIAAHALAEILRTSHDDAAQLLRATDSRHGGVAADTLLRAAGPSPSMTTPADQLLRADPGAHDTTRDIQKDR